MRINVWYYFRSLVIMGFIITLHIPKISFDLITSLCPTAITSLCNDPILPQMIPLSLHAWWGMFMHLDNGVVTVDDTYCACQAEANHV